MPRGGAGRKRDFVLGRSARPCDLDRSGAVWVCRPNIQKLPGKEQPAIGLNMSKKCVLSRHSKYAAKGTRLK
jgi:hypothetical protein